MSFTVRFMEEKEETEPEPEPEEEEAKTEKGWDGQKELVKEKKSILPEGVTLPPPNPDPDYVPTPPKPVLGKVSPRGTTSINFSEDVFSYKDIKTLEFSQKIKNKKRNLQTEIEVENTRQVKFIDVYVEPGESSDPAKLGFDYKIEFVSNKTIDITIDWENPAFVSANQPEDILVIKFNGPIYDKQDWIEIDLEFKEIRQVIPP